MRHSSHTRRIESSRAQVARPTTCDTNVAPFKRFLSMLHFGSLFCFWHSVWSPSTWTRVISELPRALDLGATTGTWTRSHPEYLDSEWPLAPSHTLRSASQLLFLFVTFSWPGKNEYVNMQSCYKLIATNLNVCLICANKRSMCL